MGFDGTIGLMLRLMLGLNDTFGGGWRRYLLDRSSGPATFTSSLQPATSETTQNFGTFWLAAPVGITVTGKVKRAASANLILKFENISSLDWNLIRCEVTFWLKIIKDQENIHQTNTSHLCSIRSWWGGGFAVGGRICSPWNFLCSLRLGPVVKVTCHKDPIADFRDPPV